MYVFITYIGTLGRNKEHIFIDKPIYQNEYQFHLPNPLIIVQITSLGQD